MDEASTPDLPPQTAPSPGFKNRRTGLQIFGVVQLILGCLCLFFAVVIAMAKQFQPQAQGESTRLTLLVPVIAVYGVLAFKFGWLGIGSILCRRWARAMTLISSWLWFSMGVAIIPLMIWMVPKTLSSMPAGTPGITPQMMTLILFFQILFVGFFFILIPGAFILFYRSPHVKSTCEALDPRTRWTDRSPLPVIGVSCVVALGTLMLIAMALSGFAVMPAFGTLLTGAAGSGSLLLMGLIWGWLALSIYRQKVAAWWGLILLMLLLTLSNAVTFTRIDPMDLYRSMGYPQDQIDMISKSGLATRGYFVWSSTIYFLPMMFYLLWVKRFFRTCQTDTRHSGDQPDPAN